MDPGESIENIKPPARRDRRTIVFGLMVVVQSTALLPKGAFTGDTSTRCLGNVSILKL